MKQASPYLIVANVKDSLSYYHAVFGGEIKILQEHAGKILHAELHLGDSILHFSDSYGREPEAKQAKIMLQCDSEQEIRSIYEALKKEGEVTVELQDTFFGALHGQVTDKLNGIGWVLNFFKAQPNQDN
ncbi:VOC family protein [Brevibacillus fulvus]|uniref:PhnB protein n=1 Tax=Brevibacillus fulvus TaxID=1125967 RepID=A0A938Y4C6_9BACL|nr:PhnB protein [Brevibacillus fulvus]